MTFVFYHLPCWFVGASSRLGWGRLDLQGTRTHPGRRALRTTMQLEAAPSGRSTASGYFACGRGSRYRQIRDGTGAVAKSSQVAVHVWFGIVVPRDRDAEGLPPNLLLAPFPLLLL